MAQDTEAQQIGLSAAEAARRLEAEGPNELPQPDHRTPLRIILEVLREPMLALLLGGSLIYLLIGSLTEALTLIAFAGMSITITVIQETRTERVLDALRDLTSPRALVLRDGTRVRIAGRYVVRGDAIILSEGDRVAADAELIEALDLEMDESLLTGESVPVRKVARDAAVPAGDRRPGGDDLPLVFAGALVVRGSAIAEVTATGAQTEIGEIGTSLNSLEPEPARLQVQTRQVVRVAAILGGAVSLLAVLLFGLLRGSWLDGILAGIALGMSMLPEEFPVVLTVFMAMGAWRISRAHVLTRRASAIESLGAATVLCTDKTGTLTENRMSLVELCTASGVVARLGEAAPGALAVDAERLLETGRLASMPEPVDPMETALDVASARYLSGSKRPMRDGRHLIQSYPLRPDLPAMTHVWRSAATGAPAFVAAKGAPEAIARLCRLEPDALAAMLRTVDAMAERGLRVLAVAGATTDETALPSVQTDFSFTYLGLVGFADPLRANVPAAVTECRAAGIKVVMITGDYPTTARAIATEAGLDVGTVMTGAELAEIDDAAFARRVGSVSVFARILPEQKLRIVQALKANGEIVAMTGDGVNDAPSLKAAHIGVAMGARGSDVAREASAIVLLDDDFGAIIKAISLGRRIYDNLRKAMGFIFAVHVPIAGLALLPLMFGLPILFGPMHIAFLEMIIDPVCSLVFEAETEETDVMRRAPRDPEAPLFSAGLILWGVVQGACAFVLVAAMFLLALRADMPVVEARALVFFSLVMAIIALIFVNRSFGTSLLTAVRRPNRTLALVLVAVVAMLGLTLLVPTVSALFRFGPLHPGDLALSAGAGIGLLVLLEGLKWLGSRLPTAWLDRSAW